MDRLEILDIELENLVSEKHKTLDLMDTITKDLLDLPEKTIIHEELEMEDEQAS